MQFVILIVMIAAGLSALYVAWRCDIIRPGSMSRWEGGHVGDARKTMVMRSPALLWILGILGLLVVQGVAGEVGREAAREVVHAGREGGASAGGGVDNLGLRESAILNLCVYPAAALAGAMLVWWYRVTLDRIHAGPIASGGGEAGSSWRGESSRQRASDAVLGPGCVARLSRAPWGMIFITLALVIPVCNLMGIVTSALVTAFTGTPPETLAHGTLLQLFSAGVGVESWLLVVVIVLGAAIGAPWVEEIMFRVCLQTLMLSFFKKRTPAILVTSLIFAALHVNIGAALNGAAGGEAPAAGVPLHGLPILLVLSVALGIVHERAIGAGRSGLAAAFAVHAGFNIYNLAVAYTLT